MPPHRPRVAHALAGLSLIGCLVAAPAPASGARPVRTTDTWIVTLRQPDRATLPSRRGGLRPAATGIARRRAALAARTIGSLEALVGFQASQRYTWAVSGFAARLDASQLTALRHDRRVAGIRRARPVELAGGGQVVPTSVLRIGARPESAPAASDQVSVAVVDTGIGRWVQGAWRHGTELNVVGGVDAFSDGVDCGDRVAASPAAYDDDYGHGTHVAGTIGAQDNDVGVVGVSPGVQLVSVRVFESGQGSDATVICGLDWIAAWNANHPDEAQDIDVVNMSLRGYASPTDDSGCGTPGNEDAEEIAVCAVVASGASVVVAAGNETDEVANYVPSRYDSVITVSAISDFDGLPGGLANETCVPPRGTETDDAFSRYSNFGPEVDITAPGTCVRSTALDSAGGVAVMSGTSMAAPHVAGAIARYLALHPTRTPDEVRTALIDSATLDWDAATDPDGAADRLVDVAALVSGAEDLALFTVPQTLTIAGGTDQRSVKVRLQRIGGYSGPVDLSVIGDLPAGVTSAGFSGSSIPAGELGAELMLTFSAQPDDGERTVTIRAEGQAAGPSDQVELTLRFDRTPPWIGAPWPRIVLRTGTWRRDAPVRLSWDATDAQGPLGRLDLQRSVRDGAWSTYRRPRPTARRADAFMEHRTRYAWRVKAVDTAGNAATSDPLSTRLVPTQSGKASASTGWTTVARTTASAKDLLVTSRRWSTLKLTFSGRAVAVVAPTGPGKGRFRVRLDGAVISDVDQATSLAVARRIVFASGGLTPGQHTLRVTALAGPVELDAFLVLK